MFIFDLDNTLFDAEHCSHLAREKRWEEFHARAVEDEPVPGIQRIFKELEANANRMMVLTGRTENWRKLTEQQLYRHGIHADELHMRPVGDFRPDHEFKIAQLMGLSCPVIAIFEDRDSVVKALRAAGYCVLQVRESLY